MTISLDTDIAERVEAEATRTHGGNVSAWFNEMAHRATLEAVYRRAAEERRRLGIDSEERLERYARERRAVHDETYGDRRVDRDGG